MPLSTTSLVRFTAKLSRCLTLALLPALASEAHALSQPQRKSNVRSAQAGATRSAGAVPYLAALGPLPLRFARPAPEPADEPPVAPKPVVIALPVEVPASNELPAKTPEQAPAGTPTNTEKPVDVPPLQPDPATQPALPILPDDTKRELRPEDVLPFFNYPNASATPVDSGVQVVVPFTPAQPQSNPLPPSSATYQIK